jgi:hypothetical protein
MSACQPIIIQMDSDVFASSQESQGSEVAGTADPSDSQNSQIAIGPSLLEPELPIRSKSDWGSKLKLPKTQPEV